MTQKKEEKMLRDALLRQRLSLEEVNQFGGKFFGKAGAIHPLIQATADAIIKASDAVLRLRLGRVFSSCQSKRRWPEITLIEFTGRSSEAGYTRRPGSRGKEPAGIATSKPRITGSWSVFTWVRATGRAVRVFSLHPLPPTTGLVLCPVRWLASDEA